MTHRRIVRERVLQALYAMEIAGPPMVFDSHAARTLVFEADNMVTQEEPKEESLRQIAIDSGLEFGTDVPQFAEQLLIRTWEGRDEAEALLQVHLDNWDIKRLALTDRIVLRMAVTELLVFKDIPPKVTLNEAVEVARAFGGDGSGGFVNGVLDSTLSDLRSSGKLRKSGRGLVETSTT